MPANKVDPNRTLYVEDFRTDVRRRIEQVTKTPPQVVDPKPQPLKSLLRLAFPWMEKANAGR